MATLTLQYGSLFVQEAVLVQLGVLRNHLGDAQGLCMDGSLGNEAVGSWQPEDTRDEGRASKEEEVPVEACRTLDWVLTRLSHERGYVVVEIEKEQHQEAKRQSGEHPFDR